MSSFPVRLLLAIVAALAVGPAWAGFDEGLAAYQKGALVTAVKELRPLAQAGHAEAQYYLGRVYYYGGRGIRHDYARAAQWFRKAADQGHAAAEYKIGGMYFSGRGVSQDYPEAARWWRKAADQGHGESLNNLGALYANGVGVARDLVVSYALQEVSRANGNELAADNLKAKAALMSADELQAAMTLAAQLNQPGQFALVLDRHLSRNSP
jgi:TPR repeat protein